MNKNVNILLTGGHAGTTALSVIGEIKKRKSVSNIHLFWIGSNKAIEGSKIQTLESQVLPKLGVTCFSLITGKLQTKFSRHTIPSSLKIPIGFFHAFSLLRKIKPQVVLSFGGFAAFPVVVVAWILRVPVIIHEQTAAAGRSNLASSFFATKIALSRETSKLYFPAQKIVITGNPVMDTIVSVKAKSKMGTPPVFFITGGSRGSQTINILVLKLLDRLLLDFYIIHQTGTLDFEKFKELSHSKLRYEVHATIDPLQMYRFWEKSDIVLGRAGANTVSEAIICKRPSIFIPLPFAYNDEQTKNAEFAQKWGIATIIHEKDATPETLYKKILQLQKEWKNKVIAVSEKRSPDLRAAGRLTDLILSYV